MGVKRRAKQSVNTNQLTTVAIVMKCRRVSRGGPDRHVPPGVPRGAKKKEKKKRKGKKRKGKERKKRKEKGKKGKGKERKVKERERKNLCL